ncbi:MAG: hypothetical protein FWF71_06645 [Actinomycetia bacterium]|nr:hypothetical protein [Actinomycetes bacterium]
MKRNYNNLLTVLLTALIIAVGIILPTILYPTLDQYRNNVIRITAPNDGADGVYVFDNPLPLYPWRQYSVRDTRPLTANERSILHDHGVPEFLETVLRDRGMKIVGTDPATRNRLLTSFTYLNLDESNGSPCYVLKDFDLNGDGRTDLSCAVSLTGDVISLLLSPQWQTVSLPEQGTPNALMLLSDAQNNRANKATTATGAASDSKTTFPDSSNSAQPLGGGQIVGQGSTTTPSSENLTTSSPDKRPPVDKDMRIWPFAYAIMIESRANGQTKLANPFSQLDNYYHYYYGYSYLAYLRFRAGMPAVLESTTAVNDTDLIPAAFSTEDYDLYIYNLNQPTSLRLILYLDKESGYCLGFNIQNL